MYWGPPDFTQFHLDPLGFFARVHPQSSKILRLPNFKNCIRPESFEILKFLPLPCTLKMRGTRIFNPPKSSGSSCHYTEAVHRAGTSFLKGQGNFSFAKGTRKSTGHHGKHQGHQGNCLPGLFEILALCANGILDQGGCLQSNRAEFLHG